MKGNCPDCNRSFEISDEFLAMGGSAKCPHCLVELEFSADPRSRRHPHRAPTRIDPDHRPTPPAQPPDEVDARCDSCAKSFKIDSEYLRLGGAAVCPRCGEELWIDPATDPRESARGQDVVGTDRLQPPAEPEQAEDAYAAAGGFGLGDLGLEDLADQALPEDGQAPRAGRDQQPGMPDLADMGDDEDDVPTAYVPEGRRGLAEALNTAQPTDVMRSPLTEPVVQADATLADATRADPWREASDGDFAPGRIAEEEAGEQEQALPPDPGEDEPVAYDPLAGELAEPPDLGEEDSESAGQAWRSEEEVPAEDAWGASDQAAQEDPTGETVEADAWGAEPQVDATRPDPQAEEPPPEDEQTVEAPGLFTGLASADDWASAAERWARSGFKAEDMPAFIRAEGQAAAQPGVALPSLAEAVPAAERTSPIGKRPALAGPPAAELTADMVEVSDADILSLDELGAEEAPAPGGPATPLGRKGDAAPPVAPAESWAARAAEELARQKPVPEKVARVRPAVQRAAPAFLGKLANPPVLAAALGLLVLVIVAVLYLWLGRTEDVSGVAFPAQGLKNEVVAAPEPASYQARDEALRHYGLANRLAYHGNLEGALDEYQAAQRLDPGFPHPHRAMGALFAALGRTELALQSYQVYLRLAPHAADAAAVRKIVEQARPK
jgi:tetratricopeptide (TPR) repeat protein